MRARRGFINRFYIIGPGCTFTLPLGTLTFSGFVGEMKNTGGPYFSRGLGSSFSQSVSFDDRET